MKSKPARGRPRSFDTEAAVDAAMRLFWRHGYEGTSVAMLQDATGLTPPSIYGAFGSKEALYRRCLDRYAETEGFVLAESGDARSAFRQYLHTAARRFSRPDRPQGCMISSAALNLKPGIDPVHAETAGRRAATLASFTARLERARRDGELPADADPAALARFFGAVIQGMSVQATDGADQKTLRTIADSALAAWPRLTG